jgi:hypothetical protein
MKRTRGDSNGIGAKAPKNNMELIVAMHARNETSLHIGLFNKHEPWFAHQTAFLEAQANLTAAGIFAQAARELREGIEKLGPDSLIRLQKLITLSRIEGLGDRKTAKSTFYRNATESDFANDMSRYQEQFNAGSHKLEPVLAEIATIKEPYSVVEIKRLCELIETTIELSHGVNVAKYYISRIMKERLR